MPAKFANGLEAERAAADIDLADDTPADPAFRLDRTKTGDVHYLADKFVAGYSVEIVVPAEDFHVGVADAG